MPSKADERIHHREVKKLFKRGDEKGRNGSRQVKAESKATLYGMSPSLSQVTS